MNVVCIQICASNEWEAFRYIMKFRDEQYLQYPYGTYIGEKINGIDCVFYYSKATKTRSAGACQYAIDNWNPKRIILFGTAGGIGENLKNLDIVVASTTGQYDCIEGMGANNDFFYKMFTEEIDNSWIDFSKLPTNTFQGLIATADLDVGFSKAEELRQYNVLAADWESGAFAHVCNLNEIPCTIVRGISDVPKSDSPEDIERQHIEFIKNTPIIMEILLKKVLPALLLLSLD